MPNYFDQFDTSDINPRSRDLAIRTIYGEAGDQPDIGKAAVAAVINNRAASGKYGGKDVAGVVTAPNQFEPWQRPDARQRMLALTPESPDYQKIAAIFDGVIKGDIEDPTKGATHFFSPGAQAALGRKPPSWAQGEGQQIGGHMFFAPDEKRSPSKASPASAKAGNFFDQFDAQPAATPQSGPSGITIRPVGQGGAPSIAERSDVGPAPQNADALRQGLTQLATEKTRGEPTSAGYKVAMDFMNQGSAAGQRTTPNIAAHQPNLISTEVHENDAGDLLYVDPQTGQLVKTDSNKHVALRDPADGVIKVFARTPETDEGVLSSAGRILGTGLAAGAPTARAVAPAVQAVQELKPGQQVVAAADRLSQVGAPVQVPRAVASDNMPVQQVAATASNVPIAGTPLVKAAERTIGQLGAKADEVAQGFGGAASAQEAGDTARSAIKNWITGESANTATKLYDRVDGLVNPDVKTPLDATRKAVAEIAAKRSSAALSPGKATDAVLDAVQRPDGLTYEGVKTLRTNIGEMLKGGILPEGMSGSELNKIYGALSKDIETSVQAAGGARASEAFNRANQYYKLASERRASLAKIVGADGNAPAETVLGRIEAMAGSSSRADISKLVQARKAIGADGWNEIASTVVTRLGRDVEGNFTPQRFLTAYGKLSKSGKDILFRSAGKADLASHLDDIALVSSRFKELQKFANPSGSGRTIMGGSIGTGLLIEPLTTVSSVIGARVLSEILSRPASAASVAKIVKAQEGLVFAPTPARLSAYNTAARNLINTIGAKNLTPADFLRAIQGPVPARTEDKQQ